MSTDLACAYARLLRAYGDVHTRVHVSECIDTAVRALLACVVDANVRPPRTVVVRAPRAEPGHVEALPLAAAALLLALVRHRAAFDGIADIVVIMAGKRAVTRMLLSVRAWLATQDHHIAPPQRDTLRMLAADGTGVVRLTALPSGCAAARLRSRVDGRLVLCDAYAASPDVMRALAGARVLLRDYATTVPLLLPPHRVLENLDVDHEHRVCVQHIRVCE
jgi:hypothetical protein